MIFRRTALLKSQPRTDWGGTYADSGTYASWFRDYRPHDFGVMAAQTFSTQLGSHMVNKPLLYLTQGMGNVYGLPGGRHNYNWKVANTGHVRMQIVRVDPNLPAQPGKGSTSFYVYGNLGYYEEPIIFRSEGRDQPSLKILGQAHEVSPEVYRYEVVLQDGDPGAFIDPQYLQPGRTLMDSTTQVADELNTKYAGIETGTHNDLSGHIGYHARKIEMTDKFIRLEKAARSKNGSAPDASYNFMGKSYNEGIGTGYILAMRNNEGKVTHDMIKSGAFIPTAAALLEERIAMDKEENMTWGRIQITRDRDTGRPAYTGAGYFQIVRDGHYSEHNFNLTLGSFTERLDSLYFNAVDPSKRKVYIRTGQIGIKFASQLISLEAGASPFVFDSSYFIDKVNHNNFGNERAWGAQFTEFRAYNGVTLCFVHDPTKDNPHFYPELHPETGQPIESGSYDIMDLGEVDNAPKMAQSKSNIAYVYEPEYETFYNVSNIYDMMNGSVKDGSSVAVNSKETGIYRETSSKFECWDVSRMMRLAAVA